MCACRKARVCAPASSSVIVDAVIGRRVEVMRQVIRLPVFTYSMIIGGVFALILVLLPLSSAPFI